jgi:hypothetical protein
MLSFGPGSDMRCKAIHVGRNGPAFGEIVSEGEVLDGQQIVLARFKQYFRAWRARPILELRMELDLVKPPMGEPWHAYWAARFGWRDERMPVIRSVNLLRSPTRQTRPESSEYIEISGGPIRTAILTGGLPFTQRHSERMLDVILITEGEMARAFEVGIVADQDDPIQGAFDFVTPSIVIPTAKGPPHVGTTSWLLSIDAENVVITSVQPARDGSDAILLRLVETRGISSQATVRCARTPTRANLVDEFGKELQEFTVHEDGIALYFGSGEMQRLRIEFGTKTSPDSLPSS